jgi:predicted transcriptional regulator
MPEGVGKAFQERIGRKEPVEKEERRGISLLMNHVRRRLFEYLCIRPCSHLSDISKALKVSPNTAKWHLNKLREGNLVVSKDSGRRTLYYPIGLISQDSLKVFELLSEGRMRDLYVFLVDNPGSTQSNLAKSLGISSQTATRSTQKLERLGLASKIQDGIYARFFPTGVLMKKKEENFYREKTFQKNILKRLEGEGLKPKVVRQASVSLIVEVSLGTEKSILSISTDPFSTALA